MRQATIRCTFVTPAYIGGSDPQPPAAPELRESTVRGLLHFWLRAAAGGVYANLEHVRAIEDATFGSVKEGGRVSVWLAPARPAVSSAASSAASPTDHHLPAPPPALQYAARRPHSPGQRYLFWSMKSTEKANEWRNAFLPGQAFDLTLSRRGASPTATLAFQRALGALWLLTHLGGVGARSRRAAGSLSPLLITPASEQPADLPFTPPTSISALQQRLQTGVRAVRDLMIIRDPALIPPSPPTTQRPAFNVLAAGHCRIWILTPTNGSWPDINQALNTLGQSLQAYRHTIKPLEARAAFGLPIIVNDKKKTNSHTDLQERRASPMLLRVTPISPSTPSGASAQSSQSFYVAVATLFLAQFQPTSEHPLSPPPNYHLIEQWLTKNRLFSAMEVAL